MVGTSCIAVHEKHAAPVEALQTVHYRQVVQPFFGNKSAACHSCNLAFLLGEDGRLEPDKDTLTVLPSVERF